MRRWRVPLDEPGPNDARDGTQVMLWFATLGTTFTGMGLTQAYYLADQLSVNSNLQGPLGLRLIASLSPLYLAALLAKLLGVWRITSRRQRVIMCTALVAIAAFIRVCLQASLDIYVKSDSPIVAFELAGGMAIYGIAFIFTMLGIRKQRDERRLTIEAERLRNAELHALEALRDEEVRVHRAVSEVLHGTVQQRFVLMEGAVRDIINSDDMADTRMNAVRESLTRVEADLVQIRNDTIRMTSRLLSPDGLEVGLRGAVRIILGRLPARIHTSMQADDTTKIFDDITDPGYTTDQRLLGVRFVEEAVTNALKHGRADSIQVQLSTSTDVEGRPSLLEVTVSNRGVPWDGRTDSGGGLATLQRRLAVARGEIQIEGADDGLLEVRMRLPLR